MASGDWCLKCVELDVLNEHPCYVVNIAKWLEHYKPIWNHLKLIESQRGMWLLVLKETIDCCLLQGWQDSVFLNMKSSGKVPDHLSIYHSISFYLFYISFYLSFFCSVFILFDLVSLRCLFVHPINLVCFPPSSLQLHEIKIYKAELDINTAHTRTTESTD